MKNKLIVLLTLLAVPSVAFAAAGMMDSIDNFRHWIYPAYLYNLKFGVAFLIGFVIVYFVFRKQLDKAYSKFSGYLRCHPTLAVIVCGGFIILPLGILSGTLECLTNRSFDFDWTYFFEIIAVLIFWSYLLSCGLFACGRFRNKILISPLFLKVSSTIVLSAICASAIFIILTKTNTLNIYNTVYYTYKGGFQYFTHPFDSVRIIWNYSVLLLWLILYSLIILWIGNAYRWLKSKIKQRVTLQKFD